MNAGQPEEADFFLECRNIYKMFGSFCALDDVSVGIRKGEFVSILGPSGCGKTTLLRVIAGLEEHNSGQVLLQGEDVSRYPTAKRKCGIVFQSYALFPNLTVLQNVAYGMPRQGKSGGMIRHRVEELLKMVGLPGSEQKYPAQMSGGQQQRVALARALATDPSLLLLDEPLSALDARVRVKLRSEIRHLQKRLGVTTVMVTHDQEEALTMADRIVVMSKGVLMQYASPPELYHEPENPFVAGFIGTVNFLENWSIKDADTATFGDLVLHVRPGSGKDLVGQKATVSIRPEEVRLLQNVDDLSRPYAVRAMHEDDAEKNVFNTKVRSIEFRGAFYRLELAVNAGGDDLTWLVLETDVPSEVLERLNVEEGSEISVYLPPERVLPFAGSGKEAVAAGAS